MSNLQYFWSVPLNHFHTVPAIGVILELHRWNYLHMSWNDSHLNRYDKFGWHFGLGWKILWFWHFREIMFGKPLILDMLYLLYVEYISMNSIYFLKKSVSGTSILTSNDCYYQSTFFPIQRMEMESKKFDI